MSDNVDTFLAHYGVKGMKWGIRKKDPASVSKEVQDRREQRAAKFDTRAAMLNVKISELRPQSMNGNVFQRSSANGKIKDLTKERDRALKDAQLKREGKLSTTQKKWAIGGTVAAGIIVASAAVKAVDSGDFHRLSIKGKEFISGTKHAWKRNDSLSQSGLDVDEIRSRVVKDINPDFGKFGANMNCRRSTFAYEMRRRGYDVAATKSSLATGQAASGLYNATAGKGQKQVSRNMFGMYGRIIKETIQGTAESPGAFTEQATRAGGLGLERVSGIVGSDTRANAGQIFKKLANMPDGARGEVSVMWAGMPAGHSIAWEVIKGKPTLIDAQMNKIIDSPEAFASVYTNISKAGVSRLDNAELNMDFLTRWLKDA